MPKLDFKNREKDENTFTFSCYVRTFLGKQSPMKESILSLSRLLLQKKDMVSSCVGQKVQKKILSGTKPTLL